MRILVTGAKGMLGQDLVELLVKQGFSVFPADIETFDITNKNEVDNFFDDNDFDLVIHTAAYTDVDKAESEPDKAILINHQGTENVAVASARYEIPIIYISTDYVFDGGKFGPYEPNDKTNPLNVYGKSKLMGEKAIQEYNPKHYIVRTSWLYGHRGKNFVKTIIKLAQVQQELKVVDDQIGCPTWTFDLSLGILSLIREKKPYGIYHICGDGYTTWHGFALKIVGCMKCNIPVIPVSSREFPRPAKRPRNSTLSSNGICQHWEKSIKEYCKLYGEEHLNSD